MRAYRWRRSSAARTRCAGRRGSGFSLPELALVLAILGILAAYALDLAQPRLARSQEQTTLDRLAEIETALVLFAARHARLPCPADIGRRDGVPAEARNGRCDGGDARSGVPWRALGLPPQTALDGWGHWIAYRVDAGPTGLTRRDGPIAVSRGLTSAWCSCPGPNCAPGGPEDAPALETGRDLADCCPDSAEDCGEQSAAAAVLPARKDHINDWLRAKGLTVLTGDGEPTLRPGVCPQDGGPCGGAAFALVSFGANGHGAYTRSGTRLPLPTRSAAETANAELRSDTVFAATGVAPPDRWYDDLVVAPSLDALTSAAGLRAGR